MSFIKTPMKRVVLAVAALIVLLPHSLFSTPMNNVQDQAPIHTVYGSDKYFTKRKKSELGFHISPFFQHTASASQSCKGKVPAGNIHGQWNMFGLFFNKTQARPSGKRTPKLDDAEIAVRGLQTSTSFNNEDMTKETTFNPDGEPEQFGQYQRTEVEYEKAGVRAQLSFDFAFGVGAAVKAGVANYQQTPKFFNDTKPSNDTTAQTTLNDSLMSDNARDMLAQELELDLSPQDKTGLEDLHLSVYWHVPIDFKEKDSTVVTFVPYFAVGVWVPLAEEIDQNKPFSASLGNDGFTGFTVEGSLGFDFPKSIQINLGGGAVVYSSRELTNQRVPVSEFQVGMIPWKTNIDRKPGTLWYVNASFKAEEFINGFSFYFDYIYSEHEEDEITVKDPNSRRKAVFQPKVLEQRSAWKAQYYNTSLTYKWTDNCLFGAAVQGYINGDKTYRPTTFLGSIVLKF